MSSDSHPAPADVSCKREHLKDHLKYTVPSLTNDAVSSPLTSSIPMKGASPDNFHPDSFNPSIGYTCPLSHSRIGMPSKSCYTHSDLYANTTKIASRNSYQETYQLCINTCPIFQWYSIITQEIVGQNSIWKQLCQVNMTNLT